MQKFYTELKETLKMCFIVLALIPSILVYTIGYFPHYSIFEVMGLAAIGALLILVFSAIAYTGIQKIAKRLLSQ